MKEITPCFTSADEGNVVDIFDSVDDMIGCVNMLENKSKFEPP